VNGQSTYPNHRLMAWVHSLSIPTGALALLAVRICFGYPWPFPAGVGLVVIFASLYQIVSAEMIQGYPCGLRRQSIYSGVWGSLVGLWLYSTFLHDVGLAAVLSLSLGAWPLSHLEVAKLEAELRNRA
jgi:hypothetical protein